MLLNTMPFQEGDSAPPEALAHLDTQAQHEAQLMLMARTNPELFAPLYEAYFPRIYAYCRRRSSSEDEAEDLVSQVFTRALTGLHTYRGGMVAAWLFQIAHNVVVRHYQKNRRPLVALDELETDLPADSEDFQEQVEQADEGRILAQLVAELPDEQRDLLAMSFDAGLTSNEIGAILGKNPTAVRVQIHRVIKGLRERYMNIIQVGDNRKGGTR